jgi:NAD(P)-dependent dehydrogenase (short-subunit alcohol dehydrogenase family)
MPSKDQVAIITGGAAGIGKACAIRFAKEGMRLVLGDLSREDGAQTLELLQEMGADVVFEDGNIAEESFCKHLANVAVRRWNRIVVLVANAANRNFSPGSMRSPMTCSKNWHMH